MAKTGSYNKPLQPNKPSKRGMAQKPERRMTPVAYASMLRRMVGKAIDPAMRAYSRHYGKIMGLVMLAGQVDQMITLDDGSKISSHLIQRANGMINDTLGVVRRTISYKGSTETAAGADAVELPSNASLWRSQRALPVGSTVQETLKLGKPSVPTGRGFNPVKVVTFRSDQKSAAAFNKNLYKSPAFQAKGVGVNEIHTKLIPIQQQETQARRCSLMYHPNVSSSYSVQDTRIKAFWDTPTNDGDPQSDVPGARTSYFPYNLSAKFRYVNLNEVLLSKVRISVVQLCGPNTGMAQAELSYSPQANLNRCTQSMPPESLVSAEMVPLLANAYDGQPTSGDQMEWGYTPAEFAVKIGSYDGYFKKSIKTAPAYKEQFHEVYNTGFITVGAGSAYAFDIDHHINRNFSALGNLDRVDTPNTYAPTALFLLVETKGRGSTEFYKATRTTGATPELSRLFSSGTGPVSYGTELTTSLEFTTQDQPVTQTVQADISGLPYKKSYMKIDNEVNVSSIINVPFSQIVSSETEILPDTKRYIVPVVKSSNLQGSSQRSIKD